MMVKNCVKKNVFEKLIIVFTKNKQLVQMEDTLLVPQQRNTMINKFARGALTIISRVRSFVSVSVVLYLISFSVRASSIGFSVFYGATMMLRVGTVKFGWWAPIMDFTFSPLMAALPLFVTWWYTWFSAKSRAWRLEAELIGAVKQEPMSDKQKYFAQKTLHVFVILTLIVRLAFDTYLTINYAFYMAQLFVHPYYFGARWGIVYTVLLFVQWLLDIIGIGYGLLIFFSAPVAGRYIGVDDDEIAELAASSKYTKKGAM